jgi:hypothetical protein
MEGFLEGGHGGCAIRRSQKAKARPQLMFFRSLLGGLYLDDKQVERLLVQKLEPGRVFLVSNPTETFASALAGPRPVLYVRLKLVGISELA